MSGKVTRLEYIERLSGLHNDCQPDLQLYATWQLATTSQRQALCWVPTVGGSLLRGTKLESIFVLPTVSAGAEALVSEATLTQLGCHVLHTKPPFDFSQVRPQFYSIRHNMCNKSSCIGEQPEDDADSAPSHIFKPFQRDKSSSLDFGSLGVNAHLLLNRNGNCPCVFLCKSVYMHTIA